MSDKRIRWTLRALLRFDDIGAYIENDNPDADARVVARIVTAVDMLRDLPATGRGCAHQGTREIVQAHIPHIVPYRVGRDIEIITVMHAHQKWPKAFQRFQARTVRSTIYRSAAIRACNIPAAHHMPWRTTHNPGASKYRLLAQAAKAGD
ncbi:MULTISPECIES: type II toxin-antitoxin system RelE/ParE family toxin [Rhizobium/Agrobacterium group]|uniref:type II toxin-antitoxin system RelE/ParE family toxin n=1 Tax=Pararhizobium antarcticum TaxID=1798805 RepID=UPI0009F9E7AB